MNQPAPETDVFISYAHADRPFARQLAEALRAHGLVVWWDRHLATGSEFAHEIETQLMTAKVVLGVWSTSSVRSGFVRDECGRALAAGKLLPVRIDEVALPLGFGQVHTLDLVDWEGDHDDENFAQLVSEIQQRKGQTPTPLPAPAAHVKLWRHRSLRGLHRLAPLLLTTALVFGGGWWGWQQFQRREADAHFLAGLERQGGREPDLVRAFSEYLIALQRNPQHGLAHYYLANIYVLRGQPEEALAAFQRSLREEHPPLEVTLRREAEKQVKALSADAQEAKAIDRPPRPPSFPPPPQTEPPQLKVEAQRPPSTTASPSPSTSAAPAPTTVARLPPRIEPPREQRAALARRVDAMFGSDKDLRIAATTGLIVEAPALSDAAPLALDKALATLRRGAALDTAASSGIVNTLVLLQSALPGTLQVQREPIEALLAATQAMGDTTRAQAARLAALLQQANGTKPVAYLQIANEQQRPIAEALAERFRLFGYEVPAIVVVGDRAPERTELRVQGRSERGFARWLVRVVGEMAGVEAEVQTLRGARPGGDAYEVWLGKGVVARSP